MEKQKHIFVCSLIFIAIICLTIMNIKYDRLSRYPYQEKEAREIIERSEATCYYEPQNTEEWSQAYARYCQVTKRQEEELE